MKKIIIDYSLEEAAALLAAASLHENLEHLTYEGRRL
jgi:hypothetical protein